MVVLVIEDDQDIAASIEAGLATDYSVDLAYTGQDGKQKAQKHSYDAIILDVVLPDTNGVNVLKQLRQTAVHTPILILTGQDQVEDKVAAFEAGADDYLTKPFSMEELKARIGALRRRGAAALIDEPIRQGDPHIDPIRFEVMYKGKPIKLRRKEFNLLMYFVRHPQQLVTRSMILHEVWGDSNDPTSNTVDVHIKYLRDKLDKRFKRNFIQTVPGMGYKLAL